MGAHKDPNEIPAENIDIVHMDQDGDISDSREDYQISQKEWSTDTPSSYATNSLNSTSDASISYIQNNETDTDLMEDDTSTSSTRISCISSQSINHDTIPKTFLQLKGISVANYNMGCNLCIAATIRLMIQYDLNILAIQEHTPWNRDLSQTEINSIERTCNKWGFSV
jgi:hypothetical protein